MGNQERVAETDAAPPMRIEWTVEALSDIDALRAHLAENSPAGAKRVLSRIFEAVTIHLADNPHAGRPGRIPGTRELVISRTSYVIPYQAFEGYIEILRVYHGAQEWPDSY